MAPPSQAAARETLSISVFLLFFAQGGGKKNPANSGTRIKVGEECYFAIASSLQGALVLQWCWDASLLMNCLCEITKHTITKSSKETTISSSAHHPIAHFCSNTFRLRKVKCS